VGLPVEAQGGDAALSMHVGAGAMTRPLLDPRVPGQPDTILATSSRAQPGSVAPPARRVTRPTSRVRSIGTAGTKERRQLRRALTLRVGQDTPHARNLYRRALP